MKEQGLGGWTPCPASYLRRWAVQGIKADGARATTIFDLRPGRHHVAVYPATIDTFALLIDRAGVHGLLAAVEDRDARTVPGTHAVHGPRRLGLRPYEAPEPPWTGRPADAPPYEGPMELYVDLPGQRMQIIYRRERLVALQNVLAELALLML